MMVSAGSVVVGLLIALRLLGPSSFAKPQAGPWLSVSWSNTSAFATVAAHHSFFAEFDFRISGC